MPSCCYICSYITTNDINPSFSTFYGSVNGISEKYHFDIKEEYDETHEAMIIEDAEEIVDGLIDICVVAIGTLDAMGINAHKAWDGVLEANMAKEVGIKEERPNPLGLPDLIKPAGWKPPSHKGNHGLISKSFEDEIDYNKVDVIMTERRWDFSPDEY